MSASVSDAIEEPISGGPPPDSVNPFAQIQSLDAEIRAIEAKRDRARHDVFAELTGRMASHVDALLQCGFTRSEIAKALDLTVTTSKAPRTTNQNGSKPKKGPASFNGWLNLFRKRGQRAYATKNHVTIADIPPAELAKIDEEAKTRAGARCSASPSLTTEENK